MIQVYLSKSNYAKADCVDYVRLTLDRLEDTIVSEHLGGEFSSKPLLLSDIVIMIPPEQFFTNGIIGRGQYLQLKEYSESKGLSNVFCISNKHAWGELKRVKDFSVVNNPSDWNNYCQLYLDSQTFNLNTIIKIETIINNTAKLMSTINNTNVNVSKMPKRNSIKDRIMSQLMPVVTKDLGLTMDGNICVFKDESAIAIDKDWNLINYPEGMAMSCDMYLISKPLKDVKVGDIVKINNSYGKVREVNVSRNELRLLNFTGTKGVKVAAKDGLLNINNVQVVLNIFGDSVQGMNPLLLMCMLDKDNNGSQMDSVLPFLLMSQQNQQSNNVFSNINPMMLMMLMGDKENFDPMMLMLVGGSNLFNSSQPLTKKDNEK